MNKICLTSFDWVFVHFPNFSIVLWQDALLFLVLNRELLGGNKVYFCYHFCTVFTHERTRIFNMLFGQCMNCLLECFYK